MTEVELKDPSLTMEVPAESEISNVINMNNICRLCANENEKLIGIFTEDGLTNDLANKMNLYLPVKVSESDQLPLQCCWQCASTVLAWHDLVVTSVEADRRLRHCDYVTLKGLEYDQEANEPVSGDENVEETTTTTDVEIEIWSKSERENALLEDATGDGDIQKCIEKTNVIVKQSSGIRNETSLLKSQYRELVDAEKNMCLLCKSTYENKRLLKAHMKTVHNVQEPRNRRKKSEIDDGFFCSVCDKGFTRKYDMEKHVQNKHPTVETSSLNNARKTTVDLKILEKCKVINEDKTMYFKCDYCSRTFNRSWNLLRHRTIHSGVRPYCCHICGKIFRLGGNLARHINEHHHKLKKFDCEVCHKKFLCRNTRDEHMNTHTNNRPFICDTCGKAFKQAASLHIHKLFHTNIFKFTCDVCGKKFRRAQELKKHQWMHTGEKPFKCDECNVAFRSNQSLKKHLRGHGKSVECVCRICGSTFIHERYLKIHSRIHIQDSGS